MFCAYYAYGDLPNYRLNIINPAEIEDLSGLEESLQMVFGMLKYRKDLKGLKTYIEAFQEMGVSYEDTVRKLQEKYMSEYTYITLRERSWLKEEAATWFHDKWGVPREAYLECMEAYLNDETEYGWYLCIDGERIVGGLGVIANDFHNRKDLTPNVCAVYTEKEYRCRGIAGKLLDMVVEDLKSKGITPIYLITEHTDFYERYGWEFLCMVQADDEPTMLRMYKKEK